MKKDDQIIRVAAVQMDFNLAAALSVNYLEEPANLKEGEKGITALRLSEQKLMSSLRRFRRSIDESYSRMLNKKLDHILRTCFEKKVDLITFPEYSIPASCLEIIKTYAEKGITIIAGSHTVLSGNKDSYDKVGLDIDPKNKGKSICPIFFSDNRVEYIEKLTKSKAESKMKLGDRWDLKSFEKDGKKFNFTIFLCIDFIYDTDKHRNKLVKQKHFDDSDFIVVPSYSPVVQDFENRAWSIINRYYKPVIYANAAAGGNSKIYCHFEQESSFVDSSGSYKVPQNEEAIVIVDLNVHGQFSRKPTSFKKYFTSNQIAVLPFVYSFDMASYEELMQAYSQSNLIQKRNLISEREDDIYKCFHKSETLRLKFMEALNDPQDLDEEEIDFCFDTISFPHNDHSVNEWRFDKLSECLKFLKDMGEKCNPEENKLIAEVEASYKKHEDNLFGVVRKKVREKYYKGISPYIHTVKEKSEEQPSFFVFRLTKRKEQKDSIDNHIKFISTLTHFSNVNLALALRYITFPDPSPIGKRLEIALIGKVIHPDEEQSRALAHNFSHDIFNLLSITMQNAYEFEPISFTEEKLFFKYFRPFQFNHVVEISRNIRINQTDEIKGYEVLPLKGNSTMIRICEMMLRQNKPSMLSIYLQPTQLSSSEIEYYEKAANEVKNIPVSMDSSMFLLGSERNPSRYLTNVTTIHNMMSESSHLELPNSILKIYLASEEPFSNILINTVGSEIAGGNNYEYCEPITSQEREIAINNLSLLEYEDFRDCEKNADSLGRERYLFNAYDAARAFRFPLGEVSGEIPML